MVKLEANKNYLWCSCGLSKTQPFCDMSHVKYNKEYGTDLKPVPFKADKTKRALLCRCKHTRNPPYCDFSHVGVMFRTAIGL